MKNSGIQPRFVRVIFYLSLDRLEVVKYGTAEPDFAHQLELAFENLKTSLEAAGCSFEDIVDVTTFHTDPEHQFGTFMEVKQKISSAPPYPNWTAIGVNWLVGFHLEIKVITRVPE